MLKDVARTQPRQLKELGNNSFFLIKTRPESLLYKQYDAETNKDRIIVLKENEYNHGHSFGYIYEFITLSAETEVIPVDVVKMEIQFKVKS